MFRALMIALALSSMPALAQSTLKPFEASYTADWKQVPVSGSASRSLVAEADGRWKLSFEASMLVAGLSEVSTFRVENEQLVPLTYRFNRSGLGSSKSVELDFDWQTKQVLGNERGTAIRLPINLGMLDKSSYQQALQQDVAAGKTSMTYQVIDGDEIDAYDFRVLGEEVVRTKAGLIDAIKVERVRDPTQSQRKTTLWFAKDWNYLLVRLHQVEKDGKEYQIMLKEGHVDGREVVGRSN